MRKKTWKAFGKHANLLLSILVYLILNMYVLPKRKWNKFTDLRLLFQISDFMICYNVHLQNNGTRIDWNYACSFEAAMMQENDFKLESSRELWVVDSKTKCSFALMQTSMDAYWQTGMAPERRHYLFIAKEGFDFKWFSSPDEENARGKCCFLAPRKHI